MSREYKAKVFFYDGLDFSTGKMISAEEAYLENYIEWVDNSIKPTDDSSIIVFWTGLKDKNNIDIYEGDIMKGNFATGIGGVSTKYKEFNFSISYHQRQAQFGLDMPEHYGSYRFLPYLIQCEIIGNIYQNPELLNKK